jgi:hypothetical protein
MQSKTDIFNFALTLLGAHTIQSPTENSRNAKALLGVYDMTRRAELRKRPNWNFAIKTIQLAADGTPPIFGRANAFTLPADFLAVASRYQNDNDFIFQEYTIEGNKLYSDVSAPYDFRYVADVTQEGLFDPIFAVALGARLAATVAEVILQSNQKTSVAEARYASAIADARRSNSLDIPTQNFPTNYWERVRS